VSVEFQIAGGTVTGREHVALGRNNQDAFCWSAAPEATVAVVADGCGSGRYSEVGAHLGARLVAESLRARAARFDEEPPADVLERVRLDVLARLRILATAMGGRFNQVVSDYFLFTTLAFVVTPRTATVFGIGDGVFGVNGATSTLTAADNAPPYLGYGLAASHLGDDLLPFVIHVQRPAVDVHSLLVATDGAAEIPALSEFWEGDRYFANPYNVGRRLVQLNRQVRPGLLPDDTTLVVWRRGQ
jgi:hypothetical protein